MCIWALWYSGIGWLSSGNIWNLFQKTGWCPQPWSDLEVYGSCDPATITLFEEMLLVMAGKLQEHLEKISQITQCFSIDAMQKPSSKVQAYLPTRAEWEGRFQSGWKRLQYFRFWEREKLILKMPLWGERWKWLISQQRRPNIHEAPWC